MEEGPSREAVSQVVEEGVRKESRSQIPHEPVRPANPHRGTSKTDGHGCRMSKRQAGVVEASMVMLRWSTTAAELPVVRGARARPDAD